MNRMTVAELITTLELMDPDAEVRIASQPGWPLDNRIDDVVEVSEGDGTIVFLATGTEVGYLSSAARVDLGW